MPNELGGNGTVTPWYAELVRSDNDLSAYNVAHFSVICDRDDGMDS